MNLASYRTLGRTGLRISPLVLGTLTFDEPEWGCDQDTALRLLQHYVEAGGNTLDTANGYAGGRAEQTIAKFLRTTPSVRDGLVLATKFAGNLHPGDPNGGGSGRKAIVRQLDESLTRLGTDYVDLYWQHYFDRHTPIEETIGTLQDLITAGKIRYYGLSDTPAWAVARAASLAEAHREAPVAAIQVEYSLLERTVEGELFGAARALGIGVTPWGPLAGGVLSGRYTRTGAAESGRLGWASTRARLTENTDALLDALHEIATAQRVPVSAVALAWVGHRPEVTATIIGCRTLEQLESNLASLAVTLSADQLATLDSLTAPALPFPFAFLDHTGADLAQGGTTINGIPSRNWHPSH
ncbi:aldo/keto reductase [Amycolatopsis jiangsuensis]|uniref:Aryl-alcohol dehydrogenase-like predicted oxidoreductase n=1 Tax=Amycolatopsis jiangsuensis TaxID=1181879 RepID=A0A840IUR5_9PSEU|nr:aldo/keto reductase [Amycolatopsis jiangsuensis]MBB4685259.1 aryl-alcohol dehydrogenase-like predicted oxidoreductase [Amycolatopsis jiangsuensis]